MLIVASPVKTELVGHHRHELEKLLSAWGEAAYHGRQLFHWIYGRGETQFKHMSNLPRPLRTRLAEACTVTYPSPTREFLSQDGTVRYLLALTDGEMVETVFVPEEHRNTLCLSTQVGCALDCRFCFTALLGVKRNLTAGEIVGQVLAVRLAQGLPPDKPLNLVFMGMGEPLLNYDNVLAGVRLFADPQGMAIPPRRITLSTSGITPRIKDLAREPVRPKLAVSLNASSEEQRTRLMPMNKKYTLQGLIEACREYPLRPRERLTFEYVMMEGVNDTDADARRVAELLRRIRAKVNLIPFNPGSELPYRPSSEERILGFQRILKKRGVPTFIRLSRGRDIRAACGQLSLADVAPAP